MAVPYRSPEESCSQTLLSTRLCSPLLLAVPADNKPPLQLLLSGSHNWAFLPTAEACDWRLPGGVQSKQHPRTEACAFHGCDTAHLPNQPDPAAGSRECSSPGCWGKWETVSHQTGISHVSNELPPMHVMGSSSIGAAFREFLFLPFPLQVTCFSGCWLFKWVKS